MNEPVTAVGHIPYLIGDALIFHPAGKFRAGKSERLVPIGSEFLARMDALRIGWVKWKPGYEGEQVIEWQMALLASVQREEQMQLLPGPIRIGGRTSTTSTRCP